MPRWDILGPWSADGVGGVSAPPPRISQTTGPILDSKTASDRSGLEILGHVTKFYINVTDDVRGRVKGGRIFLLSLLTSPGKASVGFFLLSVIADFARQSSCIRLKPNETTWIVSGTLISTLHALGNLLSNQGHPRS